MIRHSAIGLILVAACAGMPSAWALPGFKLQQHSEFYGESIAEVSAKSMRLQSSRLGLKLHVAAPSFAMTAVNDKNKQFAQIPLKQWTGFVMNRKSGTAPSLRGLLKRGKTTICGVPVEEYWLDGGMREAVVNKAAKECWFNGKSYNTHYWVATTIHPPPKTYEIFSNALGMPSDLGLPLRMVQYNADGRAFTTFDTKRIEKADINDKLSVPAGYTKAADEMALLVGDSAQIAGISELLNDGDELVPAKTKKIASRQRVPFWVPGMDLSTSDAAPAASKRARGGWTPGG
jgi:hypothetical protein